MNLDIVNFLLSIGVICCLYVPLMIADGRPKLWSNSLLVCMGVVGMGSVAYFVPTLHQYADTIGKTGLFLMLFGVMITYWRLSKTDEHTTKTKRHAVIVVLVIIICGIVSVPVLMLLKGQSEQRADLADLFHELKAELQATRAEQKRINQRLDRIERNDSIKSEVVINNQNLLLSRQRDQAKSQHNFQKNQMDQRPSQNRTPRGPVLPYSPGYLLPASPLLPGAKPLNKTFKVPQGKYSLADTAIHDSSRYLYLPGMWTLQHSENSDKRAGHPVSNGRFPGNNEFEH